MEETKTTPQDTKLESKTIEGKVEQPSLLDWQQTAEKYSAKQVDWNKIQQYSQPEATTRTDHNYQYDLDYQQPALSAYETLAR